MGFKYTNLEVRGKVYANTNAVAEAFGVTPTTVRRHIQAGTLHRVGLRAFGVEPTPVRIRGKVYGSATEAAHALGVGVNQVYRRLEQGRPDDIGCPNQRGQYLAKQIQIGPLRFRSMAEADRQLGFGKDYVSNAYRRGSKRMLERVMAAALMKAAQQDRRAEECQ